LLRDNRDFRVIHSHEPVERTVSQELIDYSFKSEVAYAKARNLTLNSLVTTLKITDNKQQNNTKSIENGGWQSPFSDFIIDLEKHLEKCKDVVKGEKFLHTPQAPYRCRLSSYLPSQQLEFVICFLSCIECIHEQSFTQRFDETVSTERLRELGLQTTQLANILDELPEAVESELTGRWLLLERLKMSMECLCIGSILVSCLFALFRSTKGGKKGKKATFCPLFSRMADQYNELVDNLKTFGTKLKNVHRNVYLKFKGGLNEEVEHDIQNILTGQDIEEAEYLLTEKVSLMEKMKTSYDTQERQVNQIIEEKLAYIETLRV